VETGARVGKYSVGRKLGQGGFGVLYVARDTELDRELAIKFLRPEHVFRPQVVQRFLQEARAAARINHPGIVTVFECGQVSGTNTRADGTVYIAMELLAGETLALRIRRAPMSLATTFALTRQLAGALAAAHQSGIVHRDLKPQNIFLIADPAIVGGERIKILDFGIAKLADGFGSNVQTQSMEMLGTPMYMSPEQCKSSAKVDLRSDIYSLGCIVFEMVCGRAPFDGDSGELIAKHQLVPPPFARDLAPAIPPQLDALLGAMLAKSPDQRPQTMEAVIEALDAIEQAPSARSGTVPPEVQASAELATTVSSSARGRGVLAVLTQHRTLAIGAASAIAIGVMLGIATTRGGGQGVVVAVTPPPAPPPAPPAQVVADAPIAVAATPPDAVAVADTPDGKRITTECLGLVAEAKWPDLARCADKLAPLDPKTASAFNAKAGAEMRADIEKGKLEAELASGSLPKARKHLDAIPDESVYSRPAQSEYDTAEQKVIDDFKMRAAKLRKAKRCAELDTLAAQASAQSPRAAAEVHALKCETPAPAAAPAPTPAPPVVGACDQEALLKKAEEAVALGNHNQALARYETALACKSDSHTLQLTFMEACNATNVAKARVYWARLAPDIRERALQICVRNKITRQALTAP